MNNIAVVEFNDKRWDDIVTSFSNYDVYYLRSYIKAFYLNGDGEPALFFFNNSHIRAIKAVLIRCINGVYDTITPYGYGGFLFDNIPEDKDIIALNEDYVQLCNEMHIICDFVRYHPILNNANYMKKACNVDDLGHTISLDLQSADVIWANITSKNRNMIRKAEKYGVCIQHGRNRILMDEFIQIYKETMQRDSAEQYYYFCPKFFDSILDDLSGNVEIFFAKLEDKVIAMSLIIFANRQLHYHLSAIKAEYMKYAPTNLLLYKVALWGMENGYKIFHLGGGIGSDESGGLYKFKASFNRNSSNIFSVGKQIFDNEIYQKLVEQRFMSDPTFNSGTEFFPKYRG